MDPASKRDVARAQRRSLWAWPLGIAVVLVACQLFTGGADELTFPHAVHNAELDCTMCHVGAEEEAAAGFPPDVGVCRLCHEEPEEGDDTEDPVAQFLVDGQPRWLSRPDPYAGEVRFDHSAHVAAEVDCAACHGPQTVIPPEEGEEPEPPDPAVSATSLRIAGGKATCLQCHSQTEGARDCAVCHKTLRQDVMPPDHIDNWQRLHGNFSREPIAGLGETTCAQCHTERSCIDCHAVEKPLSHTNTWRRRTHGLTASIDRTSCATCHQPDYCVRCHSTAQPVSHRGNWGPPSNGHCSVCHIPPTGLGCVTCHQAPVHQPGPSLPPNPLHMNAQSPQDCLVCHPNAHPDPGVDCRVCHQ